VVLVLNARPITIEAAGAALAAQPTLLTTQLTVEVVGFVRIKPVVAVAKPAEVVTRLRCNRKQIAAIRSLIVATMQFLYDHLAKLSLTQCWRSAGLD
jgi:hypothetical protein